MKTLTGNTQKTVVNELRTYGPETITTIADMTGFSYDSIQKAVQALRQKSVVVAAGSNGTATKFRLSKRTKVITND